MIQMAGRIILAALLVVSAALKLARPRESRGAMATFGFDTETGRWAAWTFAIVAELGLAAGVGAGSEAASYLAGGLMLLFAATLGSAMLAGKAGAPCACFGSGSRVGLGAIARNLLLAAAFFALPALPGGALSTDQWLGLGLIGALLACAALGVAVLALAREVGMLRLRLGPASALEVSHEGPEVGGRIALIESYELEPGNELALAVFTSVGCRVCGSLAPAVDSLRREPALSVRSFEEAADGDVWEALGIPGAPYAIALDAAGIVLAKGTFNNLAQLEGILGTAERRAAERRRVEALGV
ncbi:MAG TPA: MauE/DoxX family redox-associated membrane protein [Solirubrobacterales bacterium]|nr:MauE/DoxX family redox-associated membrane protein [Solirubrobacterales bacterium]